jgi:hypothetical protein
MKGYESIGWPPDDMTYRIGFKKIKVSDALFRIVTSSRVPFGRTVPEIDEQRALELANAWTEVLVDIATKCKNTDEMDFIKVVTDSMWPTLSAAKRSGVPMENLVVKTETVKRKGGKK